MPVNSTGILRSMSHMGALVKIRKFLFMILGPFSLDDID